MGKLIPGVTTGLYSIARSEELSTPTRKIGYALTRGVRAIELAADVPQEVTFTEGQEIRAMAKKQGLTISLHGPLNAAMELPDRYDWRDADDLMKRAARTACHLGAIYIDFHASINMWRELLTYTGRRLTLTFADHEGNFFSIMLRKNTKLRKWFIKKRLEKYFHDILTRDDRNRIAARIDNEIRTERERRVQKISEGRRTGQLTPQEAEIEFKRMVDELTEKQTKLESSVLRDELERKLTRGDPWESEDLRGLSGVLEGYHIMFRYLFYTQDPQFTSMMKFYKPVLDKYNLNFSNDDWPDYATKKMEDENDFNFKEFFYSVCAAKYIEGHLIKLKEWIKKELIDKEFVGKPELQEYARKLRVGIESPDARDPSYPGRYMIWRPKQIYSMVRTIRQIMKDDFVWMIPDFEHTAMQGADSVLEFEELVKLIPDYSEYVIAVHANSPNPLQPHNPIEYGDMRLYRCFYALKQTGLAKNRDVYLFFERGGGEDPFKKSIDALRLIIESLEKNIEPDNLPLSFFGITEKFEGNQLRQSQIVKDHAYDVMKDLLEMPEEDWTMLSQAAIRKGKKPEQWKRGEFR